MTITFAIKVEKTQEGNNSNEILNWLINNGYTNHLNIKYSKNTLFYILSNNEIIGTESSDKYIHDFYTLQDIKDKHQGYVLKKEYRLDFIRKIIKENIDTSFKNDRFSLKNQRVLKAFQTLGLLRLWFIPIINFSRIVIMESDSGVFEIRVDNTGIYYDKDNVKILPEDLQNMIDNIESLQYNLPYKSGSDFKDYTYKPIVKYINVGCKNRTLLHQWKLVLEIYKSIT